MSQRLKNIVRFTAIVPNVPTSLPHGLRDSLGHPLTPDLLAPSNEGAVVTADATNITVTISGVNGTDIDVYCEAWHTLERSFGTGNENDFDDLDPQPFVIGSDNGITYAEFVFRPYLPDGSLATAADSHDNVLTTWPLVLAALEATKNNGLRKLYFDFVNSPLRVLFNNDELAWVMPPGTLGSTPGVYDFKNVVWSDILHPTAGQGYWGLNALVFGEGCRVEGLSRIDSNALVLCNFSTTNIPIHLTPACCRLRLSGFLQMANNSARGANPDVKPVIQLDAANVVYQIYSNSPEVLFGLHGSGPTHFEDTQIAYQPVMDFNGQFCEFRCAFIQNALTSSTPGALIIHQMSAAAIDIGIKWQTWTFKDQANLTVVVYSGIRTVWFNDADNPFSAEGNFSIIKASQYTNPDRSYGYIPNAFTNPPGDPSTSYLATHSQLCYCDPTPDGMTPLTITLPSAIFGNGEPIRIKDQTGKAFNVVVADDKAPITIQVTPGSSDTIVGVAGGPVTSIQLTTPYDLIELVCNSKGQWVVM